MASDSNSDADFRILAKLFLLLDSAQEGEASAALLRARPILKKCGLPFYAAVESRAFKTAIWEGLNHPDCLREYFEADQMRKDFAQLQADSEELAAELEKCQEIGEFCGGCHSKRKMIAIFLGAALCFGWYSVPADHPTRFSSPIVGLALAILPTVVVVIHWRTRLFKRRHAWVSVTDNNLYRAAAERWNCFIGRLVMTVRQRKETQMENEPVIELAAFLRGQRSESGGRCATENESLANQPDREMRPQAEKERFPDSWERSRMEQERG